MIETELGVAIGANIMIENKPDTNDSTRYGPMALFVTASIKDLVNGLC